MHPLPGTLTDYLALAQHHYRANRPATITRILALRDTRPTVVSRFLQQRATHRTVGVLVESMPTLNCRLRDFALHNRYNGSAFKMQSSKCKAKDTTSDDRHSNAPNARPERSEGRGHAAPSPLTRCERTALLNAEVRCISRVIVHPQYRGLGLAVRLVQAALQSATTRYTEAIAAMGAVHPFFERAGMTAYRRPPHAFDDRLRSALQSVGLDPTTLAALDVAASHIATLDLAQQHFIDRELATWFRRAHRTTPPPARTEQLRIARQRLLCEPVYYIGAGRDGGGKGRRHVGT